MAVWLLKTEPQAYSIDQLKTEHTTIWDGIANPMALKYLRAVCRGDELLIYHTGKEKAIVGFACANSDAAIRGGNPKDVVLEIEFVRKLQTPLKLSAIKADATFVGWELTRLPRLSVMPVPKAIAKRLAAMP